MVTCGGIYSVLMLIQSNTIQILCFQFQFDFILLGILLFNDVNIIIMLQLI